MTEIDQMYSAYLKNKQQRIPGHTLEDIINYINQGIRPRSFLTAVLSNNLKESFAQADDLNIANMFAIVKHLYNEIPIAAWGSYEKVRAWIKLFNDKQTIDN